MTEKKTGKNTATKKSSNITLKNTGGNPDAELNRESWRVFKIMSEFVEGFEQLSHIKPAVSIFGSSREKQGSADYKNARDVARLLSDAGFSIISGGGPGIMEAANRGGFEGKSVSVGLNIELPNEQIPNSYQDLSINFSHFFTHKVMFVKYAAAYVVCPGGFGTLDEMAEMFTLVQTGKTPKIPIILMNKNFWQPLISWFDDTLCKRNMITKEDFNLFKVVDEPQQALDEIMKFYENRNVNPTNEDLEKLLHL